MHGDIFRRVVPLVAFCQARHACKRQVPRSNVRSNVIIALTLTLFRWVSGEIPALQNAASGNHSDNKSEENYHFHINPQLSR